ncbi:hypothetical protein RB628_32095 [Streptomyces sp. ADMS]|uniref:hypothetical protein n=1 Tax=Streptomyces sp. ADMS TaxID=3071415 RepID=UPI00296E7B1B|nr:hypothetical protein [Streptomyces sp. ADMS]MDW4909850.1 hypothetical protein [Streptomyces sp. ADMS]
MRQVAVDGLIAEALAATRARVRRMESSTGPYEAVGELSNRQVETVVLRLILVYPTARAA